MNETPLIDPKNMPAWIAASFVLALVALVISLGGVYRTHRILAGTTMEVLLLNKKIEDHAKLASAAPKAAEPVAAPAK